MTENDNNPWREEENHDEVLSVSDLSSAGRSVGPLGDFQLAATHGAGRRSGSDTRRDDTARRVYPGGYRWGAGRCGDPVGIRNLGGECQDQ